MIRASIDLGTNTCLLLIADCDQQSSQQSSMIRKVLRDQATIVRLGQGVDEKKMLQQAPMERTLSCLKDFAEKIRELGITPEKAICVATSQARDAKNSAEFFSMIEKQTGFLFQVISGEDEARYTFCGAILPGMDVKATSVLDIGGGSTEIMSFGNAQSVDMGSVRFTERFLKSDPVTDDELGACQEAIDHQLQSFHFWNGIHHSLVAVAGTATTLAAWHLGLKEYCPAQVDLVSLSRAEIQGMVRELKKRTLKERRELPSVEPLRADVLLAGAMILWRTLEVLHFSSCRVSTRGLRYGLLLNR